MEDILLLNKISNSLNKICDQSKVSKIDRLTVTVSYNSEVNEENLREHLKINNTDLLGNDFRVKVKMDDIEEHMAIINNIQGETFGD